MYDIGRDELRRYIVIRGTQVECNEVIRLLEYLGERVYTDVSWRRSSPRNFLYHNGEVWIGAGYCTKEGHKIDIHSFIDLLKNQKSNKSTNLKQGKTTKELVLAYFKQRVDTDKQCTELILSK